MSYRFVFGVSIIAILISFILGIIYFTKISEQWVIWAQQSFLWTGILAAAVGHVLKLYEERISKIEKQISKGESI